MSEQIFQNELMQRLSLIPGVRVWRQPAGEVPAQRGGVVKCAPVGAADLSGIVAPEGWRLEIECKGEKTYTAPERRKKQAAWRAFILESGGIHLQLRGPSVEAAFIEVLEAIGRRRAR